MLTCKLDGAEFDDPQSAMKHVRDQHDNLILEQWAYWHMPDPTREIEERVFESVIKEE